MINYKLYIFRIVVIALLFSINSTRAEQVNRLLVEVKTADKLFASTDNAVYLSFGGEQLKLDDPDRDDFERGNTDTFTIDLTGREMDFSLLRQIRELTITKPNNDFLGGGWDLSELRIRVEFAEPHLVSPDEPVFQESGIGVELDAGRTSWTAASDDDGWSFPPEPPAWTPCVSTDIDTGGEPDSDCDGIPDASDDSFDTPVDTDGDGVPDLFEDQNGTDSGIEDSDGDGWWDGNNQQHVLVLRSIECMGHLSGIDRAYVAVEDVRYPEIKALDGYWQMRQGKKETINFIVDRRAMDGGNSIADGHFLSRVSFGEHGGYNDLGHREVLTPIRWPKTDPIVLETDSADCNYRLTFQSYLLSGFGDPSPNNADGDTDMDGLYERMEFLITTQEDQAPRAVTNNPVDGYDGLADPRQSEVFMEIDHVGSDAKVPHQTVEDMASRFSFERIKPRFDDGFLGGGGPATPYAEQVTLDDVESIYKIDPGNFACQRGNYFRYAAFVDRTKSTFEDLTFGGNGAANRPGRTLVISRTSRIQNFGPIVFLHELGHSFSLCHLEGGFESPFLLPTCNANGTVPGGAGSVSMCRHYCGVPGDDNTAMGDSAGKGTIIAGVIAGAVIGAGIGIFLGPGGAVVGGIVGGVAGLLLGAAIGFFFSDAGQREFDFHPLEWQMLASGSPSSASGLQLARGITIMGSDGFGQGPNQCFPP